MSTALPLGSFHKVASMAHGIVQSMLEGGHSFHVAGLRVFLLNVVRHVLNGHPPALGGIEKSLKGECPEGIGMGWLV